MAEVQHALDTGRLVIPLLTTGFQLAEADEFLPPAAANAVRTSQGVKFSTEFFGEAVERLVAMLKHVDLGAGEDRPTTKRVRATLRSPLLPSRRSR